MAGRVLECLGGTMNLKNMKIGESVVSHSIGEGRKLDHRKIANTLCVSGVWLDNSEGDDRLEIYLSNVTAVVSGPARYPMLPIYRVIVVAQEWEMGKDRNLHSSHESGEGSGGNFELAVRDAVEKAVKKAETSFKSLEEKIQKLHDK